MRGITILAGILVSLGLVLSTPAMGVTDLGSVTVSGPVLIDGNKAQGTVQLHAAARIATGDEANATVHLAGGATLRLDAQADVVLAAVSNGVGVHVLCGAVVIQGGPGLEVQSQTGGRITASRGDATVRSAQKTVTIRAGKSKTFKGSIAVAVPSGGMVTVESPVPCQCPCGG
jgi:ferric-dicitrate binding protein FerR (iron transport regulator)